MALTDPQTLTINSVDKTCNKVESSGKKSIYATADEEIKFTVSHSESSNRTRRLIRVDQRVVASDPLTSTNEYKTLGVYIVIDEPEYGFDDTAIDHVVQSLTGWLTSANVTKILGSQH